jgi:hypothetical protein
MHNRIVPPHQPQETQTFAGHIGASDPNPMAYKKLASVAVFIDSARCARSRANRRSNRDRRGGEDEQSKLQSMGRWPILNQPPNYVIRLEHVGEKRGTNLIATSWR